MAKGESGRKSHRANLAVSKFTLDESLEHQHVECLTSHQQVRGAEGAVQIYSGTLEKVQIEFGPKIKSRPDTRRIRRHSKREISPPGGSVTEPRMEDVRFWHFSAHAHCRGAKICLGRPKKEQMKRLQLNKGIASFETESVRDDLENISQFKTRSSNSCSTSCPRRSQSRGFESNN